MPETIDDITIINRALARIGAVPVSDLDADDPLVHQVRAVHADLVEAVFGLWDWRWARRTLQLDRLAGEPFGYRAAFRFPAPASAAPRALFSSRHARATPLRDFRVEGRTVAADADELWGTFVCRIDPADWPAPFRLAYTVWLAAGLAVPVTHDGNLGAALEQQAIGTPSEGGRGGLMGRAIAADAMGSGGGAPLSAVDPLTSAHFGADAWNGSASRW